MQDRRVREVNGWLGLRHKVWLVDEHTSNGRENANKMIIRIQHLSLLVNGLRVKDMWPDPKIHSLVQFHFYSSLPSEVVLTR